MSERLFVVPEGIIQRALNYLGSRPWAEVDHVITGLRASMVELTRDSTYATVHRELDSLPARTHKPHRAQVGLEDGE